MPSFQAPCPTSRPSILEYLRFSFHCLVRRSRAAAAFLPTTAAAAAHREVLLTGATLSSSKAVGTSCSGVWDNQMTLPLRFTFGRFQSWCSQGLWRRATNVFMWKDLSWSSRSTEEEETQKLRTDEVWCGAQEAVILRGQGGNGRGSHSSSALLERKHGNSDGAHGKTPAWRSWEGRSNS